MHCWLTFKCPANKFTTSRTVVPVVLWTTYKLSWAPLLCLVLTTIKGLAVEVSVASRSVCAWSKSKRTPSREMVRAGATMVLAETDRGPDASAGCLSHSVLSLVVWPWRG
eukprot:5891030-Amphidinium_carterae.1